MRLKRVQPEVAATTVPVEEAGVAAFASLQLIFAQAQSVVTAAKAKDDTIATLQATIAQLQADAATAQAATSTATAAVQNMVAQFVCSVCGGYVPVKGYGVECLAGHAVCEECSKPQMEYGANEDGSDDVEVPLLQCPVCRRDVSPQFQCEFYFRLASDLMFDCRLEYGGCG